MKIKCKYTSKILQLNENNFTFVLQIDTTLFRIKTYFKYEQKNKSQCTDTEPSGNGGSLLLQTISTTKTDNPVTFKIHRAMCTCIFLRDGDISDLCRNTDRNDDTGDYAYHFLGCRDKWQSAAFACSYSAECLYFCQYPADTGNQFLTYDESEYAD